MDQKSFLFALIGLALAFVVPAFANGLTVEPVVQAVSVEGDTETPQTEKVAKTEEIKEDPMVCKRMKETGSRLSSKRVCRKQSTWDYLRKQARFGHEEFKRTTRPGS